MRNNRQARTERKFSAEQEDLNGASAEGLKALWRERVSALRSKLRDSDTDAPPPVDRAALKAQRLFAEGVSARPGHQSSAAQARARTGDTFRTDTRQHRKAGPVRWIFPKA